MEIVQPTVLPQTWVTDHEFRFLMKVNLTNFNKLNTDIAADRFTLAATVQGGRLTSPVSLSVPSDLALYQLVIHSGQSVMADVPGNV